MTAAPTWGQGTGFPPLLLAREAALPVCEPIRKITVAASQILNRALGEFLWSAPIGRSALSPRGDLVLRGLYLHG